MDDYFDFEEASGQPEHELSIRSDRVNPEDDQDVADGLETLPWDDVAPYQLGLSDDYPVQRPKEPCDFCRLMGFDCFIAKRGALLHGCTCCINLYRECSFTHKKTPGRWMATLNPVGEDVPEVSGNLVGKKTMRSLIGAYAFEDAQQRKSGSRLSRDATKILKAWLIAHAHHPYPTDQEKEDLEHLTGLRKSQISNWLANARRRGKVPLPPALSPAGAVDIPQSRQQPHPEWQNLNPLERWKQSPPENEPAAMTDIRKAVTTNPYPTGRNSSSSSLNQSRQSSSHHNTSSNDDSAMSMFQAPSETSFGTGQSALSSTSSLQSSLQSGVSRGSRKSMEKKERRRRRRIQPPRMTESKNKLHNSRIFQCTFCADTFPSKYDWTRHEKSLHLALERWTCSPFGGIEEFNGVRHCAFCTVVDPDEAHLDSHNHSACEEKTATERTFYRKDHLRQHLKLLHGCGFNFWMDRWKSETTNLKSRCGFCPIKFTTWQQRADHLAAHFRNGCNMSHWTGDWGFEPSVERLVENAMPPYLIGAEYQSMDPWVATRQTSSSSSAMASPALPITRSDENVHEDSFNRDSNCWARCAEALSLWIRSELESGRKPSDAALQSQGRLIVFGDDDPWNQSPADNKQWLAFLKKQNGLDNGENTELEIPKQANGEDVTLLEQLPLNPPYCIYGGLRRSGKKERLITSSATSATGSQVPELPPFSRSFGTTPIDVAVDDLDLGHLDLSMIDDDLDLGKIDLEGYQDQNTTLTSMAPQSGNILTDPIDVFAGQGIDLDDTLNTSSSCLGAIRTAGTANGTGSFDLDQLNQLAQYSESFPVTSPCANGRGP